MVAGIEVDLFRPDEELKKLAQLAVDLGIGDRIEQRRRGRRWPAMDADDAGKKWLAAWEASHDPWFNFSSGSGFYHSDRVWADYPDIPMGFIESYVAGPRPRRDAGPARWPPSRPSATGSSRSTPS